MRLSVIHALALSAVLPVSGCNPSTPVIEFSASSDELTSQETLAEFDVLIREQSEDQFVVVDYMAEWCAPCKVLSPMLPKSIAQNNMDAVIVVVDIEAPQNEAIARQYVPKGCIPEIEVYYEDTFLGGFVGVPDDEALRGFLFDLKTDGASNRIADVPECS